MRWSACVQPLRHINSVCCVLALQVFTDIKARPQLNYRVRVSYLEIYNEACSDLLDISTQPSEIVIKEDTPDRVAVKGLSMPEVCTEAEALGKLFEVTKPNRLLTLVAAAGGCCMHWWLQMVGCCMKESTPACLMLPDPLQVMFGSVQVLGDAGSGTPPRLQQQLLPAASTIAEAACAILVSLLHVK